MAFSSEGVDFLRHQEKKAAGPLTSAQGFGVIPVRVPYIDALNDGWTLLQGVAGVAGELHYRPDVVGRVRCGEVPILNIGLVAVAFLEGWGGEIQKTGSSSDESKVTSSALPQKMFRIALREMGTRPCDLVLTDLLRALGLFIWLLGVIFFSYLI